MEKKSNTYLAEFTHNGGKLIISDPCYTLPTWCASYVPAKKGKWICKVTTSDEGTWGERIKTLSAYHELHAKDKLVNSGKSLGVDSGQMGIFSEEIYPKGDSTGDFDKKDTFYGKCCKATLSSIQYGVIDGKGIVSSSGFGDGTYPMEIAKEGKEAVAISIKFI